MPYLSADKLEKRIQEAGLQSISDLLHQFMTGTAHWLQPKVITVEPEGREQIRNLLYGLLHQIGLKEFFQITSPQPNKLVLDKKIRKKHTVVSIEEQYPTQESVNPVKALEENYDGIFSNEDPLLENDEPVIEEIQK